MENFELLNLGRYYKFGQKYKDLDQHYVQKRGAYFREYTVTKKFFAAYAANIIFNTKYYKISYTI